MGDHPRDCPHGRQWGKCDTCEMLAAHERIAELEAENARLRGIIHGKGPDPDSPEWESWANTVIGRCPYHGMELTNGSWHMHVHCKRERY